jgi:TolB-like protein
MSLFDELKRRNVFRVGFAYLVLGWVLLQVVDVVLPILELPDWVARLVLLLLSVGFPIVLIFAWAFELTPEGIKREKDVDRSQSITPQTGRKLDRVVIGILAVAVIVLLLDRFRETRVTNVTEPENVSGPIVVPDSDSTRAETSIAVLPFLNMSDDENNEYFSDGISEELLNVLVRIEGLRVPSRTSSFNFKGSDKNIAEIGRELKVDHVLEGSVRKAGDRIRVTAQLIDVKTDTHLWSDSYTRQVDDIFAVQDEIAKAIVTALQITLSGEEQNSISSHSTSNVAAYNKYLQGRF